MVKRKLKVFLSHAPGDLSAARELYGQLAAEGWLDVWFGEERLAPGVHTNLEIEQAISTTHLAIVCISKDATTQSGLFQKELRLILDAEQNVPAGTIFVVPLKLEECEPLFQLRHKQFASYFGENREKVYLTILRSLRSRANGLGIDTTAKAVRVKTSATSAPFNKPESSIGVGGDASNSILVAGTNNNVTIIYPKDGLSPTKADLSE